MLTRFLGGVAACLAVAGAVAAQQPAGWPATAPATAPPAAVSADPPRPGVFTAVNPSPRRIPAARLVTAPADSAPPVAPAPKAAPPVVLPTTTATTLLTTCPSYADCACPRDGCDVSCGPCGPNGPCGPYGRYWVDAAWIFWNTKGQNVPALVTSAPAGTPRATAGVLGQPTTSVLYGNGTYNNGFRSGLYLNAGMWFDECQTCGIEGNFFFLGQNGNSFTASCPPGAASGPVLTRPFTNSVTGAGDTELVCFSNVLSGSVTVDSKTNVIGGGVNFLKNVCCSPCGRFDLLLGYQYFNLRDEINIREDLTSLPGQTTVTPGTRFQVMDQFKTSNSFNGGNIGVATERRFGGRFYVGGRAGVAFGVNHETFDINGSTTITPGNGGSPQTYTGGLLAQQSNIGHYTQDKFAVMPWVGMKVGAQLSQNVRAYVGYDFVYLSNAARAGDQIDLRVNPNQIPPSTAGTAGGAAVPAFQPRTTDFWMQGVRVGLEFRF